MISGFSGAEKGDHCFKFSIDIEFRGIRKIEESLSWSASDFEYSGTTVTGFSDKGLKKLRENKDLLIPDKNRKGERITAIGDRAFKLVDFSDMRNPEVGIKSLKLPSSIETIGREAFRYNRLTYVELPESLNSIGMLSFNGNMIKAIKIPDGVKTIERGAFTLNRISDLKLPIGLNVVPAAFAHNSLEEVEIPEGVKRIDDLAFSDNKIIRVKLPSTLKYLSGFNNNRIQGIDIPKSVEEIGFKSFDSNEITTLGIPGNVKIIRERAFSNTWHDQYIESLRLEEGLETIERYAFANNELKEVVLPTTVFRLHPNSFHKNLGYDGVVHLYTSERINRNKLESSKYHLINPVEKARADVHSKAETAEDSALEEYEPLIAERLVSVCEKVRKLDCSYWSVEDFSYERTLQDARRFYREGTCPIDKQIEVLAITGLSELGLNKLKWNKNLVLPSVGPCGDSARYIAPNAFAGLGIESLEVQNSGNSFIIGPGAFKNNSIEKVLFSEGVRIIDTFAFYQNKIKHIDFPGSLKQVGNQSFSNNGLKSFTIAEGSESVCLDRWSFSENEVIFAAIMKKVKKAHEEAFGGNRSNGKNYRVPVFLTEIDHRNNGLFAHSKYHRICKLRKNRLIKV